MKKTILLYIFFMFIVLFTACSEKKKRNMVDMEQIDVIDGTNRDRYLFRENIQHDEWRKNRYKKEEDF